MTSEIGSVVCIDGTEQVGTEQGAEEVLREFSDHDRKDSLLQQLREADQRLTNNSGRFNKASMEIGWDGHFIKRHQGWHLLGYDDEKHYREFKGIGRSTWYKMVAIAERLSHLKREEFLAMTVENAELLGAEPPSMKENPALISKAQTETAEGLAEELARDTARRENKPLKDVFVTLKLHVRQGQRKVIEQGLEEWQRQHGIDDPGYALELMIAEFRDRGTFAGFIADSIVRLSAAVMAAHTAEELAGLRDLLATHVMEMGEFLRICAEPISQEEDAACAARSAAGHRQPAGSSQQGIGTPAFAFAFYSLLPIPCF